MERLKRLLYCCARYARLFFLLFCFWHFFRVRMIVMAVKREDINAVLWQSTPVSRNQSIIRGGLPGCAGYLGVSLRNQSRFRVDLTYQCIVSYMGFSSFFALQRTVCNRVKKYLISDQYPVFTPTTIALHDYTAIYIQGSMIFLR